MNKIIIIVVCLMTCSFNSVNAQDNKIPVIRLTGDFDYDYQQGLITIEYSDGSKDENIEANIKWRGGTTNTENKHKRNYKIKLNKDYSFFGMRKDNNWILDAGQADVFRLRNRIATELWNDFAVKPYYANKEPDAKSGVGGKVVEIYLNDEYRGIYSFTENMDRKQMKLKKVGKDNSIHGVLWKSSDYNSSMMYVVPDNYDNSQPMMDVFEAKYPEIGDDLPFTDYTTLWNAINFVVNSSDDEFRENIAGYFDIPVVIDYYLFINVLNALDNIGKNMYWAVYDQLEDKRITFAVWDLDLTVGSNYLEYYQTGFSAPDYAVGQGLNLINRLIKLNVDNFNEKVAKRYYELRNTWFHSDSLKSRYQHYYDLLKSTKAAEREASRWSGDSDLNGNKIDYDTEIEYIKNWIDIHMSYLDENCFGYKDITGIKNINSHNKDIIYDICGQEIDKNRLRKGIYIRNGKKYVMK